MIEYEYGSSACTVAGAEAETERMGNGGGPQGLAAQLVAAAQAPVHAAWVVWVQTLSTQQEPMTGEVPARQSGKTLEYALTPSSVTV